MADDFAGAFAALREIMRKHSDGLVVQSDTPTNYTVLTPAIGPNKKPIWFGAVMSKKSAVTYHLYPLYFNPKLQSLIPAELRKRKQGKTCFNFKRPDATLFGMIDELTRVGREHFQKHGLLEAGKISPHRLDSMVGEAGEDPQKITAKRKAVSEARKKRSTSRAKRA